MKYHTISKGHTLYVKLSTSSKLTKSQQPSKDGIAKSIKRLTQSSYSLLNYPKNNNRIVPSTMPQEMRLKSIHPVQYFEENQDTHAYSNPDLPDDELFYNHIIATDFLECLSSADIKAIQNAQIISLNPNNDSPFPTLEKILFTKQNAHFNHTNEDKLHVNISNTQFQNSNQLKESVNLIEPNCFNLKSKATEDIPDSNKKYDVVSPYSVKSDVIPNSLYHKKLLKEQMELVENDLRILQDIFHSELKINKSVKHVETYIEIYKNVQISINHTVPMGLTICFKYNYDFIQRNPLISVKDEKGLKNEDRKELDHLLENFDKRSDRNWSLAYEFFVRITELLQKITSLNLTLTIFDVRKKEEEQKALIQEEHDHQEQTSETTLNSESGTRNQTSNAEANRIKKEILKPVVLNSVPVTSETTLKKNDFSYEYINNNEENFSRYKSDFEEIEELGKGGFGAAYKVRNRLDGNNYAVKMIFFSTSQSDQSLKSILQEVKLLSKLNHPHIVRYYQAWIEDGDLHEEQRKKLDDEMSEESYDSDYTSFLEDSMVYEDKKNNKAALNEFDNFRITHANKNWNESNFDSSNRNFSKNYYQKDFKLEKNDDRNWKAVDDGFIVFEDENDKSSYDNDSENQSLDESYQHGLIASLHDKKTNKKDQAKFKVLFIQMEFCENQTLKEHMHLYSLENNDMEIRRFLIQIVDALNYLHIQGFIHRDLKPSNIFLDQHKNIKLGDFGLAKQTGVPLEGGKQSVTKSFNPSLSFNIGTPIYMSPEQKTSGNYSNKTDMYSLGVVLFELLMPPFYTESERIKSILDIFNTHKLPPFLEHRKNNELVKIMVKLIQSNPDKRPSSIDLYSTFQDSLYQEHIISNISEYKKIIDYVFNKRGNFMKNKEDQTQRMNANCPIVGIANNVHETYFNFIIKSTFKKFFIEKVETVPLLYFDDQINIISSKFQKSNFIKSFKSLANYVDISNYNDDNLFIDKNATFNYIPNSSLLTLTNSIKFSEKDYFRCYSTPAIGFQLMRDSLNANQNITFVNYVSNDKLSREMIGYYQAENIKILVDILSSLVPKNPDLELMIGSSFLFDMLFEKIKLTVKLYSQFFLNLTSFYHLTKVDFLKNLQETLNFEYKKNELIYQFLSTKESDLSTFKQKLLCLFPNDALIECTFKELLSLEHLLNILNIKGLKIRYATYPPMESHFPLIYSGYLFWIGNNMQKGITSKGLKKLPNKAEPQSYMQYQTIAVGGRFDNLIARGSSYFDNARFATGFILYKKFLLNKLHETNIAKSFNFNYISSKNSIQDSYTIVLASYSKPLFEEKLKIAADIWALGLKTKIYFEEMNTFDRLIRVSKNQNLWLLITLKPGIFVQHNKIKVKFLQKELEKDYTYDDFKAFLQRKINSFDEFIKVYISDFSLIESDK